MPTVTIDDVALHYEVSGEGRPLLLTHGLGASSSTWQSALPLFGELGYRSHAIDQRGHGASTDGTTPYTIERLAEDLRRFMDELGIARATLAGHSVGGRAMLLFALMHPARVERLVLYGTQGAAPVGDHRAAFEAFVEIAERDGMEAVWRDERYQRRLPRLLRADASLLEIRRAEVVGARASGFAATLRAILAMPDLERRVSELACSTLLLYGAEDGGARFAERAARAMPNATLALVPEAGHFVHLERPGAFVDALRVFLRP